MQYVFHAGKKEYNINQKVDTGPETGIMDSCRAFIPKPSGQRLSGRFPDFRWHCSLPRRAGNHCAQVLPTPSLRKYCGWRSGLDAYHQKTSAELPCLLTANHHTVAGTVYGFRVLPYYPDHWGVRHRKEKRTGSSLSIFYIIRNPPKPKEPTYFQGDQGRGILHK